jgi:ABC-2 type transport system permease protein
MFSYLTQSDPAVRCRLVDFSQLKILIRVAVRSSFRGYGAEFAQSERSIRSGFRNMLVTYFITSIGLCALAALCGNQTTYNTLLISYGMMMTAFAILIEYNDLILNAEDAEVLFTKPISSQTIYWSRLATLSLFVLLYSGALLLLPSVASFYFSQSRIFLAPFSFLIMLLACLVSALGVVYAYVQLLRWVDPRRLTACLTYFQTGFSLLLFYGYYKFLLYEQAEGSLSIAKAVENVQTAASSGSNPFSLVLDQSTVFYFLPPAWFAGTIDLLLGDTGARSIGLSLAAISLLILVVCLMVKGGPDRYLSLLTPYALEEVVGTDFRERLFGKELSNRRFLFRLASRLGAVTKPLPPSMQSGYRLVTLYLKRDARLRRAIYPFFGIVFFYFVYAIDNPYFVTNIFQASSTLDVLSTHAACVLLPLCILIATNATQYCSDWKAAWVFRTAPITGFNFYLGYRLALFRGIYGPIWLASLVFYWFDLSLRPLLLQMLALLLIIQFLLALSFRFDAHLPLSQPPRLHAGFLRFTSIMLFLVAVSQSLLALMYLAAKHHLALAGFYLALLGLTILVEFYTYYRVKRLSHAMGSFQ